MQVDDDGCCSALNSPSGLLPSYAEIVNSSVGAIGWCADSESYSGSRIVGFEVEPVSVKHELAEPAGGWKVRMPAWSIVSETGTKGPVVFDSSKYVLSGVAL